MKNVIKYKQISSKKIRFPYLICVFAGILFFIGTHTVNGEIISTDRRITWNPGMLAGIPIYTIDKNVKTDCGAVGNGTTDDTTAIQNCINSCTSGKAVYFPAGTYKTTSELLIDRKSIVLRGAGPVRTRIKNYATSGSIIKLNGYGDSGWQSATAGYTRGSTTITVADSSGFTPGQYLMISNATNDSITEVGSGCGRADAQIFVLSSNNGNVLTPNRPLYYGYNRDGNNGPQVSKFSSPITMAGVEDISVERAVQGSGDNITINSGMNCWVKNVNSYMVNNWHVRLQSSYGCVVRDSFFSDAWQRSGNSAYGVALYGNNTDNLIENNIFYHLRHAMLVECGGQGNVFGYNYSVDTFGDSSNFLFGDMLFHGGFGVMNLFEGNIGSHIMADNVLGNSRWNTYFRNQATQKSVQSVIYHLYAVDIMQKAYYFNLVGNVFGTPGETAAVYRWGCASDGDCSIVDPLSQSTAIDHGNYNYTGNTIVWDAGISDHTIPNSLYLTSKPSFFGSYPWPAIGPDVAGYVQTLPAKKRFDMRPSAPMQTSK